MAELRPDPAGLTAMDLVRDYGFKSKSTALYNIRLWEQRGYPRVWRKSVPGGQQYLVDKAELDAIIRGEITEGPCH